MREAIFQADITDLVEPGMRGGGNEVEDVLGMLVDDVVRQSSNHPKDGELSKVEDGRSWKTASQKVSYSLRGKRMQPL